MICSHQCIRQPQKGNEGVCINCGLDIIFDGTKWTWTHGIDANKARKLRRIYAIDQHTGAHA